MVNSGNGIDIYRRGYGNMRTPLKHNLGSKFRPMRSTYLEMFILDKHRSRLGQEKANLSRRIAQIEAELVGLNHKIEVMKGEMESEMNQMGDEASETGMEPGIRTQPMGY